MSPESAIECASTKKLTEEYFLSAVCWICRCGTHGYGGRVKHRSNETVVMKQGRSSIIKSQCQLVLTSQEEGGGRMSMNIIGSILVLVQRTDACNVSLINEWVKWERAMHERMMIAQVSSKLKYCPVLYLVMWMMRKCPHTGVFHPLNTEAT